MKSSDHWKKLFFLIGLTLFGGFSCERSPERLYKVLLGKTPTSVTILHGKDQYFLDCCIWLHFKISEPDLKGILKDFEQQEIKMWKWKSNLPPNMDWWKPEQLGSEVLYFEKASDNYQEGEGIYTSNKFDEVYYVNWAGH